ncbi:hypothetical protein ILUMI_18832, partial [Ignelater luminosus]
MTPNTSKRVEWSPGKRGKAVTLRKEGYTYEEIAVVGWWNNKVRCKETLYLQTQDQRNQLQEMEESQGKCMVKAESDGITKKPKQPKSDDQGHHPSL